MPLSILLITYNGELYIEEQLISILSQMNDDDELLIIDDCSSDCTIEIIDRTLKSFSRSYNLVINSTNRGITQNIYTGLKLAVNEVIVFSDQDDIWLKDKLKNVRASFESKDIALFVHNAKYFGTNLSGLTHELSFKHLNISTSLFQNIKRNAYIGCCMAINRAFFPERVLSKIKKSVMHDWLLSSYAISRNLPIKIDETVLMLHRRHERNLTPKKSDLLKMLKNRLKMIKDLL